MNIFSDLPILLCFYQHRKFCVVSNLLAYQIGHYWFAHQINNARQNIKLPDARFAETVFSAHHHPIQF
jgi:hypothetical protein